MRSNKNINTTEKALFKSVDEVYEMYIWTLSLLDEVADLPLHMQVKLLRVIQEKAVMPIGAREEVKVDVRVISASHQILKPLVESGKFRSDLYFRLNVIELHMPSLQDRREDIPLLANHFLKDISEQWHERETMEISPAAMDTLKHHNYTGNVRELINILQRAVTMCEGSVILPDDLMLEHMPSPVEVSKPVTESADPGDGSLDTVIEDIEKQMLEEALRKARYNKTKAAELLGISFRSFRYKLKKYGID